MASGQQYRIPIVFDWQEATQNTQKFVGDIKSMLAQLEVAAKGADRQLAQQFQILDARGNVNPRLVGQRAREIQSFTTGAVAETQSRGLIDAGQATKLNQAAAKIFRDLDGPNGLFTNLDRLAQAGQIPGTRAAGRFSGLATGGFTSPQYTKAAEDAGRRIAADLAAQRFGLNTSQIPILGPGSTAQQQQQQRQAGAQSAQLDAFTQSLQSDINASRTNLLQSIGIGDEENQEPIQRLVKDLTDTAALELERSQILKDEVALSGRILALQRRRETAIRAEVAKVSDPIRKELAQNQATADIFERRLRAEAAAITSGELRKDPDFVTNQALAQADERAIQARTALEAEQLVDARTLADEAETTAKRRNNENQKALIVEREIAKNLDAEAKLVGETAQLRRLRNAKEKQAALSFSSGAELGRVLGLEGRNQFQEQANKARVNAVAAGLRAGDGALAKQLRTDEVRIQIDKRLDALKRSVEFENESAKFEQQNAKLLKEEFLTRRRNEANRRAREAEFLTSNDPRARAIVGAENRQRAADVERKARSAAAAATLALANAQDPGKLARETETSVKERLARQLRKAEEAEFLAGDSGTARDLREAEAKEREAKRRRTAALAREEVESLRNAQGKTAAERQETAALQKRLLAARRSLGLDNRSLQLSEDRVQLGAQVNAAEAARRNAIKKAEQVERRNLALAMGGSGGRGGVFGGRLGAGSDPERGPSVFQRAYAKTYGLEDAMEAPRGRKFLQQRFLQSAGFAFSGALLFGGATAIRELVREAEELEVKFNLIQAQLESAGRGDQFEAVKNSIFDTARATAAAADEVANVQFQFQGAFGNNTIRAIRETREAFETVKVTGLEIKEVIDAFTALTQNEFKLSIDDDGNELDVTIESISDKALGLQERLGVLAKETISFAADLAPVAASLGFTAEELEALGAVSQKYSGRSGASLAEAFGRLLPQIQASSLEIAQLFEQAGLETDDLNAAFAAGDIAAVFKELIANYDLLGKRQQNFVIDLLGGRREAAALIPVLENGNELLREFGRAADDAGKQNEFFARQQETLGFQTQQLAEQFKQFGVELFEAGLGDLLKDIVQFGGDAVDVLSAITDIVSALGGALNSLSGGNLDRLLELGLTFGALRGAGKLLGGLGGRTGVGGFASRFGTGFRGVGYGAPVAGAARGVGPHRGAAAAARASSGAAGRAAGTTAARSFGRGLGQSFGRVGAGTFGTIGLAAGITAFSYLQDGVQKGIESQLKDLDGLVGNLTTKKRNDLLQRTGRRNLALEELSDFYYQDIVADFESSKDQPEGLGAGRTPPGSSVKGTLSIRDAEQYLRSIAQDDRGGLATVAESLGLSGEADVDNATIQTIIQDLQAQASTAIEDLLALDDDVFGEVILSNLKQIDPAAADFYRNDADALAQYIEGERARFEDFGLDILDGTASLDRTLELLRELDPSGRIASVIEGFFRLQDQEESVRQSQLKQIATIPVLEGQFESGEIGLGEFQAGIAKAIDFMRQQEFSRGDEDKQEELREALRLQRESMGTALINQAEGQIAAFERANGPGEDSDLFKAEKYVELLKTGELNQEQEAEVAALAIEARRAVFQAGVDQIDGAAAQAERLAQGFEFDTEIQVELLQQHLQTADIGFQTFSLNFVDHIHSTMADFTDRVATLVVETGADIIDATIDVLEEERAHLVSQLHIAGLDTDFDAPGRIIGSIEAIDKSIEKARTDKDLLASSRDLPRVSRGTGTASQTDLRRQAADDVQAKNDEALEAARAAEDAQADLLLARLGDGDIAAAQKALGDANRAIARAETEAERLQGLAAKIRAERSLSDAIFAVFESQIELLQAAAQYAGDPVEVARLQLQLIREQIGRLPESGLIGRDLERAQNELDAQLIAAEGNLRDSRLQEERELINYQLEVGKITKGQAINALQALLAIPDLTERQVRELTLEIQRLREQVGGDYRFNLPSELRLPTIYEARRLSQSGGAGQTSSYNDNRQINVNVNVTEPGATAEQIGAAVAEVIGDPSRSGTVVKRY